MRCFYGIFIFMLLCCFNFVDINSLKENPLSVSSLAHAIKEVIPSSLSKIVRIISTTIKTGNMILILKGGEIELECNGDVDSLHFTWNKSIADRKRFYIHENGNLEIKNIQLDDDGVYTCSSQIENNDEAFHTRHLIHVYEIPSLCHQISWNYLLYECNQALEEAYRDWLFNKLPDAYFSVNNSNWQLKYFKIHCEEVEELIWELRVEICMGYPFSSIKTDHIYVEFANIGALTERLENLQRTLRQFTKISSFPSLDFQSQLFSVNLLSFCQSGRYIRFNVCLSCPLGYYSTLPAFSCLVCEKGFYNDKLRTSHCYPCPKGTTNTVRGATSVNQCKEPLWLTIFWYFAFLVPSFIGWICVLWCCVKKKKKVKREEKIMDDRRKVNTFFSPLQELDENEDTHLYETIKTNKLTNRPDDKVNRYDKYTNVDNYYDAVAEESPSPEQNEHLYDDTEYLLPVVQQKSLKKNNAPDDEDFLYADVESVPYYSPVSLEDFQNNSVYYSKPAEEILNEDSLVRTNL